MYVSKNSPVMGYTVNSLLMNIHDFLIMIVVKL